MTGSESSEDRRITAARQALHSLSDSPARRADPVVDLIIACEGMIEYAEERLRINVGLGQVNAALRKRIEELEHGP